MSTIAFDGSMIAFDTQLTCESMIEQVRVNKVLPVPKSKQFLYAGGVGDPCCVTEFINWLNHSHSEETAVEFPIVNDASSAFIAIDKTGTAWIFERLDTPVYKTKQFLSIGSGSHFALGAMAMGATAEEAVKIAGRFDVYTSGVKSYKIQV